MTHGDDALTGRSPVRCAVRSKTPSGAAVAENMSPTPDPRTRGEHGTEHAAQDPFAVTRDDAAEVDEIRELGRTLGGEKKTPPRTRRPGVRATRTSPSSASRATGDASVSCRSSC